MSLILLVEGAMIVVFTALDLFLFFLSWEVTMIPLMEIMDASVTNLVQKIDGVLPVKLTKLY